MNKSAIILVILVLIGATNCTTGIKEDTYYRITKVESFSGFSTSSSLLESICLGKLIHFGHFDGSMSAADMFKVGAGARSGSEAHFFEMYPSTSMLIKYSQSTDVRCKTMDLQYDNKHFALFPYRGTSEFFSAPSSDIIVKTEINGKSGSITIDIGKLMSIKLKVKESTDWDLSRDKILDIKDLIGDYYPFDVAFRSVSGTIQFTNLFLQRQGQKSLIKEPVDIIVAQLKTGELYCLGFICSDRRLQDPWGRASSSISSLSREAGFASPIPISQSKQTINCRPKGDGTIICGGGTDSIELVFNTDSMVLKNSPILFFPYGLHWSSQILQ